MAECQSRRVERLAWRRLRDPVGGPAVGAGDAAAASAGVDGVAHHRVSHVLQMHPDLVGPAALQLEPKQFDDLEPGYDASLGLRLPSVGADRHALAVSGMAGDWSIDP